MRPTRKVVAMAMRMVDGMGLGAWGTWAWGTWVVRPGQTTLPTAAGALVIDPAGTPEIFAANAAMPAETTRRGAGRAAGASGGSAEEGQKWTGRVAHSEEPGDQRGGPPTRDGGREKAPKPAVEAKPAEEAEGV